MTLRETLVSLLATALQRRGLPKLASGRCLAFVAQRRGSGGWDLDLMEMSEAALTQMGDGRLADVRRTLAHRQGQPVFCVITDGKEAHSEVIQLLPDGQIAPPAGSGTPQPASEVEINERVDALAKRLVFDPLLRPRLLALSAEADASDGKMDVVLMVVVRDFASMAVLTTLADLSPRDLIRDKDPDGPRVVRDLELIEKAGRRPVFLYVVAGDERLAYCVSLHPIASA